MREARSCTVGFTEILTTANSGAMRTIMSCTWTVMPLAMVLASHGLASRQALPHHHPTTVSAPTDTLHSPLLELYPSVTPSMVEAALSQRRPFRHSRGDDTRSRTFAGLRQGRHRSWRIRDLGKWSASLQALDRPSGRRGTLRGETDRRGHWWVTGEDRTTSNAFIQPLQPPSPASPANGTTLTPRRLPHTKHRHRLVRGKQGSKKPTGVRPPTPPTSPMSPITPLPPAASLPPTSPSTLPPPTPLAEDPAVLQSPQDLMYDRQPRWFALDRLFRMLTVGVDEECENGEGRMGKCMLEARCRQAGGTPTSSCAYSYATCCVAYQSSCGSEASSNRTYWVSPPVGTSDVITTGGTCTIRIKKISSSICYIRLDFNKFKLMSPVEGNCIKDHLVVSGQNINAFIPKLCGNNSGQHLYIDADTVSGPVELSINTVGEGLERLWEIEISQIECSSPYRPPANCLQYYIGTQGTFSSFNYNPDTQAQYLNNLNYVICIRKEAGFCSIVYQNPSMNIRAFEIVNLQVNATGLATSVIPAGEAGVGLIQCPDDYIIMAGTRLCGDRLNDASSDPQPTNNGPVTDSTNGPFIVQFTSDDRYTGHGFQLFFQQHPC